MSNRTILLTDRVYLSALDNYDGERVRDVVFELLDQVSADNQAQGDGFLGDGNYSGKNVLIKPNLLAKHPPEACITTSPVFVRAACEYFLSKGACVTVADSPGGLYNAGTMKAVYQVSGMRDAAEQSGARLNTDFSSTQVYFREGRAATVFHLIQPVVDADLIVNLCRLKTHALCGMSAAVKNMFGAIPGLQKAEMHACYPAKASFANMLVDLCLACAPSINLTDAVISMEGNGPAGGTLKRTGFVVASANPFSSDLLCCYLMGRTPKEIGTVAAAIDRGLCPSDVRALQVIGQEPGQFVSELIRPDSAAGGILKQLPNVFGGRLIRAMEPRPVVDQKRCIGCGECKRCCPADTIEIRDKKAHIVRDRCIKCFCCQELCPVKAVEIKRNPFLQH